MKKKKILLFIVLEIILLGLLFGGLSLYHNSLASSSQNIVSKRISIERARSSNDSDSVLILNPAGTVDVNIGTVVTWTIRPLSNVVSFRIEKKQGSSEIFRSDSLPPRILTREGSGRVDSVSERIYNYNIFWKKRGDSSDRKERRFDPKLALRPNKDLPTKDVLFYLGYAVLSIATLLVLRKT